ncbi:MAG: PAS domain S-box protein [Chitinispirillaceae bacterium]|nr:PAS domain S-box protein [Chitinispirillaceae bacterium]
MTDNLIKVLFTVFPFGIFSFGVYVYLNNRKGYLNRLFFAAALFVTYRLFCEGEMRSAASMSDAVFWANASFLRPLVLAIFLHFIMFYTGVWCRLNRFVAWSIAYMPAIFFSGVFLLSYDKHRMLIHTGNGWVFDNAFPTALSQFHLAWALLLGTSVISLLWVYYKKTMGDERKKIRLFSSFFTQTMLVLIMLSLLKRFRIIDAFYLNGLVIIIAAILMGYLIIRYRLFLPPSLIMEEVFSSMDDGLVIIGNDGNLMKVNTSICTMTGYSEKELFEKPVSLLFREEQFISALTDQKLGVLTEICQIESTVTGKTGTTVPVQCVLSTLTYHKRAIPATLVLCRNLTYYKQIESELHKAHKVTTLEQLTRGITHDFNNLLNTITLHLSMLDMDSSLTDKTHMTLRSSTQAARMAADILKQFSVIFNDAEDDITLCNIGKIIRESATIVQYGSDLDIQFENIDTLPVISGNSHQLMRVFLNLFINARQTSDEKVRVTVSGEVNRIDRQITISVSDDGRGMPEKVAENIFIPFFTTKSNGSGLGLAVVKNIVNNHNGTVSVSSTEGKGTTFTITLPGTNRHPEGVGST